MCGIVGILADRSAAGLLEALPRMVSALSHRGPDAEGLWTDAVSGIGLGHRRLSIVELSDAGAQPMVSASGRYVIVFNGEIYNHLELRRGLATLGVHTWRGHSDTETLLAAMEVWGLEETLRLSVGMFAIAVWDSITQTLQLARDRFGEKPLYYWKQANLLGFASELKAIQSLPSFDARINRQALGLYMQYGYVPAPYAIYEGVFKLTPGSILAVTYHDGRWNYSISHYWTLEDVVGKAQAAPYSGNEIDAQQELLGRLEASVSGQMLSDVPLGAFLSGGVDSSTVVAVLQKHSAHPVRTFTVGFGESAYSELEQARAIARYLGAEHTELVVSTDDALALVLEMGEIYDEPFADASQIPTLQLMRLARAHVKVCLTGDGADEMLGGYQRYFAGQRWWQFLVRLPRSLRGTASWLLLRLPTWFWSWWSPWIGRCPGQKIQKLAQAMTARDSGEFHRRLMAKWVDAKAIVPGYMADEHGQEIASGSVLASMMFADAQSYLPDDILVKVDRAAMSCGLETRAPYLDHRLVDFAWTLPESFKIRGGRGKWILRKLLCSLVPSHLVDRPKLGFDAPIAEWLRGPLHGWAKNLLGSIQTDDEKLIAMDVVWRKWEDHQSGRADWSAQLWCVLMFQAWYSANRP